MEFEKLPSQPPVGDKYRGKTDESLVYDYRGREEDGNDYSDSPRCEVDAPQSTDTNDSGLEYRDLVLADGATYKGQVDKTTGKRQGTGVWCSGKITYEGQWRNDEQSGQGRQLWGDGRVFNGQFEHGMFAGHGRMEWHTRQGLMIYDGQYQRDKKHGHGRFIWPDGRMYDGSWEEGMRSGKALYKDVRGNSRWGQWVSDHLERWFGDDEDPAISHVSDPTKASK